jgi:uncharacterized membrane protein
VRLLQSAVRQRSLGNPEIQNPISRVRSSNLNPCSIQSIKSPSSALAWVGLLPQLFDWWIIQCCTRSVVISHAYLLLNVAIRSYTYRILKATRSSRVGVRLGILQIVRNTLFFRLCVFKIPTRDINGSIIRSFDLIRFLFDEGLMRST